MLVEFSVQNFRSIHQRQTLSLVASKDKTLLGSNTISTNVSAVPRLLPSVGLYGANGSGKTTLLNALSYFQWLVRTSFSRSPEDSTLLVPFAFQDNPNETLGELEVTLLIDGVRYQYGFRLDSQRIHEEWLLAYKTQKGQAWFERKYNPATDKDEYQFSDKLQGAKKIWQESTRSNALFLSTAIQFNSEMLRPVYDWIANKMLSLINFGVGPIGSTWTAARLVDPVAREQILSFLRKSDIQVHDIKQADNNRLYFQHRVGGREQFFDLETESLGTQKLFSLAGPVLQILDLGMVLVIDEMENSMHPLLVQRLLELFHDPAVNKKGAQLVFSTHNTLLLDQSMFRRDQIWMVEKDANEATKLVPLTEFKVRKDLSLEKAYLQGRFGAIPILTAAEP